MTLADTVLRAPDIASVRQAVEKSTASERRDAVEPLAVEVLKMMRTDTRRALEVAERAAVVAETIEDPRLRARAVWMRGHGLSGVLRNEEASDCYERAAAAYREIGDRLQEAKVSIGWINTLMYLGDYPRAVALGERARKVFIRRGLFPEAARIETNLGSIHHRVERPVEALKQYDRALRTARQLDDAVMERIIQFNRATVLTNLGRLDQAERIYDEVLAEALAEGETRTAGFTEYSLGYLELLRGEYGAAYERLDSARAVFESLEDPHLLTLALTDLAELFVEMNGFRRAKTAGRRARTLAQRHGIRFEVGRSALFEAIACLGLGEQARAASHLENATRAFRQEGNRVSGSVCALYLADISARRGDAGRAVELLNAAVEVFSEEGMVLREASALTRLAAVELGRGRLDDAGAAADRARRIMRRTRSPWLEAQVDHLGGRIAMERGDWGLATRRLRRAVRRVEGIRGRIGIDEFRISFGEDKAPVFADLVHSLLQRRDRRAVAEAFDVVERSRSRALVDLLAGRIGAAHGSADPAVARMLARLEKLRAELNWLSGFDPEQRKGRRDEARLHHSRADARRVEEEIADLVQRLQSRDRELGALTAGETVSLGEIRRGLGDATLVEYYVSGHGVVAFVASREGARVVPLDVTPQELADAMSRLRFQLEKWGYGDDYVARRAEALRRALDDHLGSIARRVWDPLGISTRRVIVVPHGPLHSLPFHALIRDNGRAVLDDHVLTLLPSASASRYLSEDGGTTPAAAADARVLAVGVGDASIPQADHEAEAVRRCFPRGRLLRGPRATRERFLKEAAGADVVHVATHGAFREDDPHFSALRLADGWMSLYDLYGMRLRAGLVCLSACQSGRSWVGGGDEIVGLTRGFLHAGARSLVVSLWPVQDESTAEHMEALYRHLRKGEPAEEALRAAQLEVREKHPHPYQWAPFVLIGRGGPVAGPAGRRMPFSK